MSGKSHYRDAGIINLWHLTALVLLGFIVRLYAFRNSPIINPDGIHYINQAKALLNGDWDLARNCGYNFISLYHLLIPVAYKISGDWIVAAKSVSLFFGTAAILPFYLIMKQFFRNAAAVAVSLGFSMHPFFVAHSVELIKDPIFWFFALFGIFFFIVACSDENKMYFFIFSSVFFLVAVLARFEILIYLAGSVIYIAVVEDKKRKKIFIFCLPIIVTGCLLLLAGALIFNKGSNLWAIYFLPRVEHFFYDFFDRVVKVNMLEQSIVTALTLLYKTVKAAYFPFLPFIFTGLLAIKEDVKRDRRFLYFIFLSLLSLAALYLLCLKTGILSPRYTVMIILPGFVFMCSGIEKILQVFRERGFREKTAFTVISAYMIITVVATHSLFHARTDKIIYRAIGEYIAVANRNTSTVLMASDPRVMFYANIHSNGLECSNPSPHYKNLMAMKYEDMISFLKDNKVNYFLWEEKLWSTAAYDFLGTAKPEHSEEIARWNSGQGKIVLFRMLY